MRIVLLFIFQLIDCRRDQVDASTAQLPDDISNADLQRIKNVYCQSASRKFFEFCRNDPDIPDLPDYYPPEFIIFVIKVVRQSNELCDRYYQEFHNVSDLSLVSNSYVAAGGQGMVFKCECSQDNIDPAVTAQKVYYWTFDKNMTELAIVSTAVAEAGVRAPLYWFHDKGYFEEFMGHKKDMWDHPTELRVSNETVWRKTAINIAETHQLTIDNIDKEKYTRPYKQGSGFWNTREIKSFFEYIESFYDEETINTNKKAFLDLMGWTVEEYDFNVQWSQDLIRNYYKDEEIAVVAHNDPHAGNMMMDRNDTTGQSLILIDWDLCQYGYRVFDLAYYMFYGSFVHVAPFIGNEDFDYDDPGYIIDYNDYYMPEENIKDFLTTYLNHANHPSLSIEQLTLEFNLFTAYINLMELFVTGINGIINMELYHWSVCKLEEMQKLFDHPNPINCRDFPFNKNQCDECDTILVDCISNCDSNDPTCLTNCNRDFATCIENC